MGHELQIGKWRFDPSSGEIHATGVARRLEPRVAQVLCYLAERPGEIVSRRELLATVWRDSHVVDAAVWRAVSTLRRQLDDTGDSPSFVETVPRRGYRLVAPVRSIPSHGRLPFRRLATVATLLLAVSLAVLLRPAGNGHGDATLQEHIGALPLSPVALYETGMRYYRRYRPADNVLAREMFDRALSLDPDFALARAGLSDTLTLEFSRFDAGTTALDAAIQHALQAIRSAPASAEGYKALGFAYRARGWTAQSAAASRQAIQLRPDFAEAIHNLAGALEAMGQPVESLRWRLQQPMENTDRALLLVGIGRTLAAIGDEHRATRYLQLALVAEPHARYASYELARLELRQAAHQRAHDRLEETLARHPACGECHALLGDADRARGRDDEALGHYRDGSEAFGGIGDPRALLRFGVDTLLRTDGRQPADAILERLVQQAVHALDRGDQRHEPRLLLAMVEAARGRQVAALDWLSEAIDHGLVEVAVLDTEPAFDSLRTVAEFVEQRDRLSERGRIARRRVAELDL